MKHCFYHALCGDARDIRTRVFVEEQGFCHEFDEIDQFADCLVLYDGETPVATGRLYPSREPGEYILGRIAVIKSHRGQNLGAQVISLLEERARELGARCACLSAQCRAQGFYEKQGYRAESEPYLEEFCPHVTMKKSL